MNNQLTIDNLHVRYGNIQAVRGVSFDVRPGEIVTLIGANGAGKSSVLRAISGLLPYDGNITWENRNLRRMEPDKIVACGIAQSPEGRAIFGNLTVEENLRLAAWQTPTHAQVQEDLKRVYGLFPRLRDRLRQLGGTLSGGEQQMLAIGRTLMSRARLLLLDEPSMGLAPALVREIFKIITDLNRAGVTILMVEQNANMALQIAHRAYVLETGCIVKSGSGAELLNDPRVQEAYLG